ncbi:hypothetical protein BDZ97DRAFT_1252221 [Flammula alnicola]|nr:hypothetical protein BDZ97DRAFT_1252221 [Flammula alnicola]
MPIEHLKLAHIPSKHVLKEFGACQSLQKEEIEVLESIYPEYISSRNSDGILNLEVPVELGSPRFVDITSSNRFDAHLIPHNQEEKISLTVLPPIRLHIVLPPSYPLYGPPKITSIRATHGWLPDTIALQTALIEMWQMQESVLYRWVEHVRSGDFLQDMEIVSANDQRTIQILHPNPSTLASLLSIYDTSSQSAQFSQNSYPCSICLTHLKGIKCLQLTCKHIFCRSCLEDFWQMCIAEGDVDRVGCPHPECIKEGKKVSEEDLAHVVSESEIQRWRRLTTKQKLERDPTMLNCPIPTCQALVPKPGDADPESGWDRFRQCSSCFFSFCSFCKYT